MSENYERLKKIIERERAQENCRFIAGEIQSVAMQLVYYCPKCGEDFILQSGGFLDNGSYRCPVCGDMISIQDAKLMTLYDYFENDSVSEYRVGGDLVFQSVEIQLQRGSEKYILDTEKGTLCEAEYLAVVVLNKELVRRLYEFFQWMWDDLLWMKTMVAEERN